MKIGPHALLTTPQSVDWVRVAPIVKTVNNVPLLREARSDSIQIFRQFFPQQYLGTNPYDVAADVLGALGTYRHPQTHNPQLYVEVYNEVSSENTPALAELLRQVVPILHQHGVKVAGPSWATGDYDARHWEYMRSVNWCGLDAIALHAYWGDQGLTIWHALRYRQFWRPGDPPILITECGRDKVEGGLGGWVRDGISGEQYVSELVTFDTELQRDQHVLGATVFTAGPTFDWEHFSTDSITPLLLPLYEEKPVSHDEFDRYCADIWQRAGVPYNPNSAIATYWRNQLKNGNYLGKPEEPEHPTENGRYIVQAFSSSILHCEVNVWQVKEGLPPLGE